MKVIFMGTPDFAVRTLEAIWQAGHELVLVVTQPDKPKGRGKALSAPPVKIWAEAHGIEVFQPQRIRRPEAIETLGKYDADIIIVAAFGQILPKEILELPPFGCVNVHASLLPKYRGAAPIQWAVINGDAVSGVTTMQMGVGLDDGDMLLKEEVALEPDETGGSLFDKLADVGGRLCVRTMEGLRQGNITPVAQDETQATHVGMIRKNMGHMDFARPAEELERLVRGLDPWPSAYVRYQGKTCKIWKAAAADQLPEHMVAAADACGKICLVTDDEIWVATGRGFLILREIQLEGKKRMKVSDFLRGHDVSAGEALE